MTLTCERCGELKDESEFKIKREDFPGAEVKEGLCTPCYDRVDELSPNPVGV